MSAQPQTPAQIILSVSTSLNDQEAGGPGGYIRWPLLELLGYFNESLIEISNYRPDAFMVTADIPIIAGSQQTLNSGAYSKLMSVDANGSASGCPGAPVVECDLQLSRTFYKAPCLPTGGPAAYRVIAYAYDSENPLVFYVFPPVPAGNTSTVTATLIKFADQYNSGQTNVNIAVDQKYYDAIKFWMLARAYEVDTESGTSQGESAGYYKKFYQLFGIQYKQESDYNRGKFLGQGGANRMSKERVA
jgi:hypothetical protein